MTKRVPINVVFIVCLCAPLLTAAQDKFAYRVNLEKATQIAEKVERAIKVKEPKWKLKDGSGGAAFTRADGLEGEVWFYQDWKSRAGKVTLTVLVYDSNEKASSWQKRRSMWSSVSGSTKLDGFGEEAYYINHPYFRWMSVRRSRVVIEVYGPGGGSTVTRRFAEYGLAQIEDQ